MNLTTPLPLGTKFIPGTATTLPSQKKYTSIIFDIGGVLLDWKPQVLMAQLFPGTNAPAIIQTLTQSSLWHQFDRGIAGISNLGDLAADHGFDKIFAMRIVEAIPYNLPALPVTVQLLKTVKALGYKIYILSNMPEPFFPILLEQHDFFDLCDGKVASYTIKQIKPEPPIYRHLLQQFTINPEQALFIDDLEVNIRGGNAEHIDGVVCKDPREVAKLMHKLGIIPQYL